MNLLYKILLVLILTTSSTAFAQLPYNIGFENGNFDGWELFIGKRDVNGAPDVLIPTSSIPNFSNSLGQFAVFDISSKKVLDRFGSFPVLCPNGSKYSIRLGIVDVKPWASGRIQRITYTFDVPAGVTEYNLTFNYAIVLENAGHNFNEQPFFSAKVFNVTDHKYINCPSFEFTAPSAVPGFKRSTLTAKGDSVPPDTGPVYYKDWSTALINLKNYAGKKIRLEFTTEDCMLQEHFGYAYLDVDEKLSFKPISGNIFCADQNVKTVTLKGPAGFEGYTWYTNNDFTKPGQPGQSITVPANDLDKYALHLKPYLGLGCDDTLYTVLKKLQEPINLVVSPQVYGCPETGADLTAANVTAGSIGSLSYTYFKDQFGQEEVSFPYAVLQPGTYYIQATNIGGCVSSLLPVEVILTKPNINVPGPLVVPYRQTGDLSTAFTRIAGNSYTYFYDADATKSIINGKVDAAGRYYIKATNQYSCSAIASVDVTISPPPPYKIEASNTFTPNNDGINDLFFIKITGFVTLNQLTIYNRYGKEVFATRSINDYWTGNDGGNKLPSGTYYWVFDGVEDHSKILVRQGGSITIIR